MDHRAVLAGMQPDLMGGEDDVMVVPVGMLDRDGGFDGAVVIDGLSFVLVIVGTAGTRKEGRARPAAGQREIII